MPVTDIFDDMNAQVVAAFGDGYLCTYYPGDLSVPPFPITATPLDPIRLEGAGPSNFTLRFVAEKDLKAVGYVPVNGGRDMIVTEDGSKYLVEQVQSDSGNGVRLMLKLTKRDLPT